ncbi:MAG: hypothetical protein SGI77_11295 [Pirellulaceae bacterium]|nr:hypothetical protein [Pirellulaceae bacterium]
MTDMVLRRRRLPHQDVEGHPIFITGCLDGSLSASGLSQIEKYREQLDARPKPDELTLLQWEERKQKLLFAFVDNLLDHESAIRHLEDDAQAEIVQNALSYCTSEPQWFFKILALAFSRADFSLSVITGTSCTPTADDYNEGSLCSIVLRVELPPRFLPRLKLQ